jgi:hypothetical protein
MKTIDELIEKFLIKYPKLQQNKNWGERGLFYNPDNKFPLGAYVLTFKEKDGENDSASKIDRGGIYRLNLKISKETFIALFGSIPKRAPAGKAVNTDHDFTKLDEVMPHPVYAWMTWICILNPTVKTIEAMERQHLFEEAYQNAVDKINKKLGVRA